MPTDFGRQFEVDRRTGDILLDRDGKPNLIEDQECFDQSMFILLHTQRGEDMFDQNMGFDRLAVLRNTYDQDPLALTELKIKEALNSSVDDRIYGIIDLAIYYENRIISAEVLVRNINSQDNMIKMGLNS